MGISGYGTHFGGMILSWLIIISLFGAIIYIAASQARSGKFLRDKPDDKTQGENGDE